MKRGSRIAPVIVLLALVGLVATWSTSAQNIPASEMPQLDTEAMKSMSRADRLEYQKAYKAQLESIAKANGWVPTKADHTFRPSAVQPEPQANANKGLRVPGTMISYHSGAVGTVGVSSVMVGNHFNSALNPAGTACCFPAEASGSVTMFTVSLAAVSGGIFFSLYDQLNGTTANQVTSMTIPSLVTGLNVVTLATALNYVGSSFLAGMWQFGGDTPNLATGTTGGQGFHAISINDGMTGMSFMTIANQNAVLAVGGDVATPVELMSFSID